MNELVCRRYAAALSADVQATAGLPSRDREAQSRRQQQVLTRVLTSAIWVDILYQDLTVPKFFQREDDDGCEDDAEGGDGHMELVPAPSVELHPDPVVKGCIHVDVLPRTLPISSTHAGRPFRLVIRVNDTEYLVT